LIKKNHYQLDILKIRAKALQAARSFFWARGYLEADTPLLAPSLIPEAVITPIRLCCHYQDGTAFCSFLTPSPELWLKRLLALGSGNIFQLGRAFRDFEPATGIHSFEFSILEWYTVGGDYLDNLRIQEEFVEELRQALKIGPFIRRRQISIDLRPPYRRMTMQEAFKEYAGIELPQRLSAEFLGELARGRRLLVGAEDDAETLFHKLFLQEVEPKLPQDRPLILMDYPALVPCLAKKHEGRDWLERWELYLGGVEIANCYTEERDPSRLKQFFSREEKILKRTFLDFKTDWDFLKDTAELPACSGNALGFDRLLMVLCEASTLSDVMLFALSKQKHL